MKDIDILKDILEYKIANQTFYNENLIKVRNPEIRQVFTQLRDDEMRAIVKLQQKIQRLGSPPGIIAKIFPAKPKY
ncbi:MAG: PA2169 family four-helix-bundle protein [Clostridia bacterium]|nr:PA2169 family four-helix-bundle protein [Clostridia bacterium]